MSGHVTRSPEFDSYWWQQSVQRNNAENALLGFLGNVFYICGYYIVDNFKIMSEIQGERVVTLSYQQWLRERSTGLRYMYRDCLTFF